MAVTTTLRRAALLGAVASLTIAGTAIAQGPPPGAPPGPPPPKAANGQAVTVAGTGVPTPTAFAFDGATVFAGSGPGESGNTPGGLFTLSNGTATKVPGTPAVVFGLVFHKGELYVSTGKDIIALRGWDGTRFAHQRIVYRGGKGFVGFNGLAFGPDNRLYSGLSLNPRYDHRRDPHKPSQSVVSMTATGKHLRVVARGLRQPFQLVFPRGARSPYVTDLAQDKGKIPPDQIVVARQGADFGFPTCTWMAREKSCKRFSKPLALLPKHSSPMGIASIGNRLYISLFGGLPSTKGAAVVTMGIHGGKPKPFLTGFVAPIVALGIHGTDVYVGELTGIVYKVSAT
jgi:glucose/arabinose dehydrogenase